MLKCFSSLTDSFNVHYKSDLLDKKKADKYYQILEDKLSDDIQINETNEGKQENPCVMNLNDKFIVTWNGNGKGDKNGIFARYFNKNGIPISSEFKVINPQLKCVLINSI